MEDDEEVTAADLQGVLGMGQPGEPGVVYNTTQKLKPLFKRNISCASNMGHFCRK